LLLANVNPSTLKLLGKALLESHLFDPITQLFGQYRITLAWEFGTFFQPYHQAGGILSRNWELLIAKGLVSPVTHFSPLESPALDHLIGHL
jgi:hypothetical protein